MADEGFDPRECIWDHELATQRLLAILRQSQDYCSNTACFSPPRTQRPNDTLASSDFLMTCLIIAFVLVMYVLGPNTLRRLRNGNTKDRDDERDSNDDPPAPPPTTF
ncbi:small integral membrane protein 14 [Colletes latitarsis]|uniref:small integral membrane protein 14 n=1 Tax=Colletes latitarsis TaxID=2605962 RepID=UPI0040365449